MPPPPNAKIVESISVRDFYESFSEQLELELVTGEEGMKRFIREKSINRPALALTGYFKHFANRRLQLFGAGEMAYLRDLPEAEQLRIMREIIARHIPCIVVSRNLVPIKAMYTAAEESRTPMFRTPMKSKDFIAETTILLEDKFAPRSSIYGTLLDIKGIGTLIRGKSGVGKSECALALIERGHSLVADDVTYIKKVGDHEILGTSAELNRGYMECRGIGIISVSDLFGIRCVRLEKRIDLVITFTEWQPGIEEERTGLEKAYYEILGMKVPHIQIPVRPGRDMARLVEVGALVQALRSMGHDSATEFNERLIAAMSTGA
ncbi:HPr(Ser) kinase/phosphatase [Ruficoccus sp. ZRK36]|uniref:HPr(Ser) kinase/phosphatase n=1 Tax=Ruficoccus sp. ZRK36 TaxID=2866311 RepID=UPI001C72AA09|nr:HPr(Ser) kinase/phosphatase [Ruficoccus sp. ZRK36]QYY36850.1 HPr(Ser) kinase/phosphatase [Ruficoccus sp. ZRK36]